MYAVASSPPSAAESRHRTPSAGSTVDGRYLLRRLVASGGMGVVWEAEHLFTKRSTALKLLKVETVESEELRERLMREAHALAAARHPGFVDVLDAGVCRAFGPYLAMEMLEGRTLDGILAARERLPVADVVALGVLVADALSAAHAHGVLHRDVKPSNLFVARDERGGEQIKLIDLGIAAVPGSSTRAADRRLTRANAILGTPEYMAPEQLFARDVDARADVYALGVTLFECLTGQVPYTGTYPEVLQKVGRAAAPPPVRFSRPEISRELDACISRALSVDPEQRFQSARAFAQALCLAYGDSPMSTSLLAGERGEREEGKRQAPTKREIAKQGVAKPPAAAESGERRHDRVPYRTPVLLIQEGHTPLEARSEDVSVGGMLVVGSAALEADTMVQARFALPGSGEVVTVRAVLRWVRPGRGRSAMGLEYLEAPLDALAAIESFVASA
jgi:serine/threonine protein kinase